MTKKRSSEISEDENQEIFREKVKFEKFSSEFEKFLKIGGKSETGGECIMVSGGWMPLIQTMHCRMLTSLGKRFEDAVTNEKLVLSTMLDPCYKHKLFDNEATAAVAKK